MLKVAFAEWCIRIAVHFDVVSLPVEDLELPGDL